MPGRGALIVLEGCDRCGKTTQAMRLVQWLLTAGRKAELVRFPERSTAIGQLLDRFLRREMDLAEHSLHLLFSANRWEMQMPIQTMLDSGINVIVDRYAFSGVAYSRAKGLDKTWTMQSDLGLLQPDTVLFFDMDPSQAAKRSGFGEERLECAKLQKRVYAEMQLLRQPYWQTVNADQSIESVERQVIDLIEPVLRRLEAEQQDEEEQKMKLLTEL